MKRYDIHIERVVVGNGASYAKTVPHENPYGGYVLYADVQSLQAERDEALSDCELLRAICERRTAERDRLRSELKNMIRGYVLLLENGRDRIVSLGGSCDPLDVMEQGDHYLHHARRALEGKKG